MGILGATGTVGQKLITLLADHPWFTVEEVVASEKSAGKPYGSVVAWRETQEIPKKIKQLEIKKVFDSLASKLLFSSLDATVAAAVESHYVERGHIVISNAQSHRLHSQVPLVIPEVNGTHLQLLHGERSRGFIITNPNCVVMVLALALYPLFKNFGLEKVMVHTMQAVSGAGYPGVASMDILGNVIPHIDGEEEKISREILKLFGTYCDRKIDFAAIKVSALCNRVPVFHGHTLNVAFTTVEKIDSEALVAAWKNFKGLDLPSSPSNIIRYFDDCHRPQPRLDVNFGNGMGITIGNLRPCSILDWKCTILGHNTVRGAAGAAVLNAEHLVANGLHT